MIDELPDQIAESLLSDLHLKFKAVPQPTRRQLLDFGYLEYDEESGQDKKLKPDPDAREWAKELGFDVSYELPLHEENDTESKHHDDSIQVLMYAPEMESHLRSIRTKSQTAIEESGASILYLAFGFLEWTENEASEKSRLAPLYTIPVQLNRGQLDEASGTYLYTLNYTGEDIFPNISLREKLAEDFAIALPDLSERELPESYLYRVEKLIKSKKPDWAIRRYGNLSLLNFSKMLMYLDLDPKRWPKDEGNIVNHPVVKRIFESSETTDTSGFGATREYNIDDIKDIHTLFPVIDDADSSQHSALIDAVNGKNLVIEGPPGTGKSQTITNLIAAAMLNGKKVLFVAEKMAALEVVKSRLDRAGLGDFCLELHSHKSQKRKVLDDIDARITKQSRLENYENIDVDIDLYEEKKTQLNQYAYEINGLWSNTGLTIHEIFSGASRYRQYLDIHPENIHIPGLSGDSFTELTRRKFIGQVEEFQRVYKLMEDQLGKDLPITAHPWSGVENTEIQIFDAATIAHALSEWQSSLSDLHDQIITTSVLLGCAPEEINTLEECQLLADDMRRLPRMTGQELFYALPLLDSSSLIAVEECLSRHCKIQDFYSGLSALLDNKKLSEFSVTSTLPDLPDLRRLSGASRDQSLGTIVSSTLKLKNIEESLSPLVDQLDEVFSALPQVVREQLGVNKFGLSSVCKLFEVANLLDSELITSRSIIFDDDSLDLKLGLLEPVIEKLNDLGQKISLHLKIDHLPDEARLKVLLAQAQRKGISKWLDGTWRRDMKEISSLSVRPDGKIQEIENVLLHSIDYAHEKECLDKEDYTSILGSYYRGLETDVASLKKLRRWVRSVRSEYGIGFGKSVAIGDFLIELNSSYFKGIKQLEENGFSKKIRENLTELEIIQDIISYVPDTVSDSSPLCGENGLLTVLYDHFTSILEPIQAWFCDQNISVENFEDISEDLAELSKLQESFYQDSILIDVFGSEVNLSIGLSVNNGNKLTAINSTCALATHINENISSNALKHIFKTVSSRAGFEKLEVGLKEFQDVWFAQDSEREKFSSKITMNNSQWFVGKPTPISELIARNFTALSKQEWLNDWVNFIRLRNNMEKNGLGPLWSTVAKGDLNVEEAKNALDLATFDQLSREILQDRPHLAMVSGKSQKAIQSMFCDYDKKLKSLQCRRIASFLASKPIPQGRSGGRKSEYTEMALIKNELGKKTRHISIRQLVNRSSNALIALKPCFMMGPMSAAQYLQPGHLQFDLVVMDEASQVKPEDALGVIARGAQLIVVGDPKQLPPTSFFDKQGSDDDEDDNAAIIQTSSILDASLPLFDMRRLRWHYRSQHESLIAFSNRHFYDNNLVIFPSPYSSSDEYGVKFSFVSGARFVNQYNLEEARVVAKAVVDHARQRPYESLGVVAMSSKQRDQIERSLEEICKNDATASANIEKLRGCEDGLFIKNLENVQGDERDVIFISFTYGPGEVGGKVYQRFGPINSDVGWRRLNVLFTRSKKRMHAFSSMRAEDILLSESSKRGVVSLRNFLLFAEKGNMDGAPVQTGRAPDSDFEVAVLEALYREGFECDAQVGVAGFFVDIAVKDPGNPGKYLLAIECDGASYHSAKSARDRDRLRQEILERLGWRIRRIWSTDWFNNPRGELEPLIRELHELKSEPTMLTGLEISDEAIEVDTVPPVMALNVSKLEIPGSLRNRLEVLASEVIEVEFSDTLKDRRLLRPAMIEALIEHQPVTRTEFVEMIPEYLRKSTEAAEAVQFLDQVLGVIAEFEVEEGD